MPKKKGWMSMVEPWIVEAIFLVAGAEPAKLDRWMGENMAREAAAERAATARIV